MKLKLLAAALALSVAAVSMASPALAQRWRGGGGWHGYHHNGGWNRGWGRGIGFGVGVGIGAGLANSYAYRPGYNAPGYYADDDDVGVAVDNSQNDEYCAAKYRSYDPGSGTYLGYDGQRHPCP